MTMMLDATPHKTIAWRSAPLTWLEAIDARLRDADRARWRRRDLATLDDRLMRDMGVNAARVDDELRR